MSRFDLHLPEELRQFVNDQVSTGSYPSASEYFCELVEADRLRKLKGELEAKLSEALNEPAEPMTPADWDWVRREGGRILAERKIAP